MAKEGLYSESSGSENHTKESTQAADKTHRHTTGTHMQMAWIVRVAHAAKGRTANKALLAANTHFIGPKTCLQNTQDTRNDVQVSSPSTSTALSDYAKRLPATLQ